MKKLGILSEFWREGLIALLGIALVFTFANSRTKHAETGGGRLADIASRELELRKSLARFTFRNYPEVGAPRLRVLHARANNARSLKDRFVGQIPSDQAAAKLWLTGFGFKKIEILSIEDVPASHGLYEFSQVYPAGLEISSYESQSIWNLKRRDFTLKPVLIPYAESGTGDSPRLGLLLLPPSDYKESVEGGKDEADRTVDLQVCDNLSLLLEQFKVSPRMTSDKLGTVDLTFVSFVSSANRS